MVTAQLIDEGHVFSFRVTITGDPAETSHVVTLSRRDLARLGRKDESAESFVLRCFDFLLAREPKESIQKRFDVSIISDYFAEFEAEISI